MTKSKKLSFEESLAQLDDLVRELESSDTGLDRSLELYENGVKLLKQCRSILDHAEQRIRIVTGVDEDGNPIEDEFDATSTLDQTVGAGSRDGSSASDDHPRSSSDSEQRSVRPRKKSKASSTADDEESDHGELLF